MCISNYYRSSSHTTYKITCIEFHVSWQGRVSPHVPLSRTSKRFVNLMWNFYYFRVIPWYSENFIADHFLDTIFGFLLFFLYYWCALDIFSQCSLYSHRSHTPVTCNIRNALGCNSVIFMDISIIDFYWNMVSHHQDLIPNKKYILTNSINWPRAGIIFRLISRTYILKIKETPNYPNRSY